MKRYPSYKDSGVEWLGELPDGWEVKRLRQATKINPSRTEISGLSVDTEVSFVPMEAVGENGELDASRARRIADVQSGYTYFREGDMTFAKITPCFENGKRALMRDLVEGIGFGTTELTVLRPKEDQIAGVFLFWLLSTPEFRLTGEAHMYGAGGQKRVPDEFTREFRAPLPSLPEQRAIADFLDRETTKIDALVEEQRRLIALLAEKRQAVISHAVTRGLDPDAPLKPSGIDWPKEIPEGWQVLSLTRVVAKFVDYRGVTPTKLETGVPLITATQIKNGRINHSLDPVFISEEEYLARMTRGNPSKGDVLLTTEAPLGETAQIVEERVSPGQRIILMKVADELISSDFLFTHFLSQFGQNQLWERASGSTASGIRADRLRGSQVLVPPLKEQGIIVEHVRKVIAGFGDVEKAAGQQIRLLKERRAALISAAVTGKIDVREVASPSVKARPSMHVSAVVAGVVIAGHWRQHHFGRVKLQKFLYLAQAHAGITDIDGDFLREAAGPLDRGLQDRVEAALVAAGAIRVQQDGGNGSAVRYEFLGDPGAMRADLADTIGERMERFQYLLDCLGDLDTRGIEAVATLYAVWNDFLIDGRNPDRDEIIREVLENWHPEKAEKFSADDLSNWLGWMQRQKIVPNGAGPKTHTGRLFV